VDFALYELVLYLDAYPDCHDALDMYHKLLCRKKELTAEYESTCGPLTAFSNESHTSWDWIDKPFPWEYSAN
jgi:spore coat protein JB